MTTPTPMPPVRVDDAIKAQVTDTLAAMGLAMSDAVRLCLHHVVAEQAFPLELKVPNAQTQADMAEARSTIAARKARFDSAGQLLDELEKTAADKRAAMSRTSDFPRAFAKHWQRLSHAGRYDLHRLRKAMLLLIGNGASLAEEWLDHAFRGEWFDHRECFIGGDFLLVYRLEGHAIVFVRTGTRADLFGASLQALTTSASTPRPAQSARPRVLSSLQSVF